MCSDKNGASGFLGFLAGAVIGAGLALLYAPQTGKETRKQIKDASEKVADDVKENYDKISKEAKKSIDQVRVAAEKAIDNVKTFIEGAKDGLKKEIKDELSEESKGKGKKKA
ncbi:MAG: YtxH domain-containing protein [bacterium]|nr:YtxH domain-containing protein [bacterium]